MCVSRRLVKGEASSATRHVTLRQRHCPKGVSLGELLVILELRFVSVACFSWMWSFPTLFASAVSRSWPPPVPPMLDYCRVCVGRVEWDISKKNVLA